MTQREQSIEFHRQYCVHYGHDEKDRLKKVCSAGMDIVSIQCVQPPGERMKWAPCIEGHKLGDPCSYCPKWERPSMDSAEKYAEGMEECLRRMTVVDPVIGAWRNKRKPFAKAGVIECPVCQGKLHLAQSGYNGHVRAKCETEGCVSFIE